MYGREQPGLSLHHERKSLGTVLQFHKSKRALCWSPALQRGRQLTLGWESRLNWTHKITVIILIRQERYAVPTRGTTGCLSALAMPAAAQCPTPPQGARCAVLGGSRMATDGSAVGERWWARISSAVAEKRRAWYTVPSQVRPLVRPSGCGEVMARRICPRNKINNWNSHELHRMKQLGKYYVTVSIFFFLSVSRLFHKDTPDSFPWSRRSGSAFKSTRCPAESPSSGLSACVLGLTASRCPLLVSMDTEASDTWIF